MPGALQTKVQNREMDAGINLSPQPMMFEITSSNYPVLLEHMPWVSWEDVVKLRTVYIPGCPQHQSGSE
jgi:hypothetical protein